MELLTTLDVAQRMKVAPNTVRLWAKAGRIRFIETPGGQRLFPARALAEFKARRRKKR